MEGDGSDRLLSVFAVIKLLNWWVFIAILHHNMLIECNLMGCKHLALTRVLVVVHGDGSVLSMTSVGSMNAWISIERPLSSIVHIIIGDLLELCLSLKFHINMSEKLIFGTYLL